MTFSPQQNADKQTARPAQQGVDALALIDELQVNAMRIDARSLTGKARELEELCQRLEAMLDDEDVYAASNARNQACLMRDTAERIEGEINKAGIDPKTGRKMITTSRAATLNGEIKHNNEVAGIEKSQLLAACAEIGKQATKAAKPADSSTSKAVGAIFNHVASAPKRHPRIASAVTVTLIDGNHPAELSGASNRIASIVDTLREVRESAVEIAHRSYATLERGTEIAVAKAGELAHTYVVKPARIVKQKIAAGYDTLVAATADGMEAVDHGLTAAGEAVTHGLGVAKTYVIDKPLAVAKNAKNWAVSKKDQFIAWLPWSEKTPQPAILSLTPENPPVAANDNLEKARKQAAALSLGLLGQMGASTDWLGISVQNLPKITTIFTEMQHAIN